MDADRQGYFIASRKCQRYVKKPNFEEKKRNAIGHKGA